MLEQAMISALEDGVVLSLSLAQFKALDNYLLEFESLDVEDLRMNNVINVIDVWLA